LWEKGYFKLHKSFTKGGVGFLQFKEHIPPKWVYRKYETLSTNTESPKHNSLEKQMGHNPP
jgi:hypothetical protein